MINLETLQLIAFFVTNIGFGQHFVIVGEDKKVLLPKDV